MKTIIIKIATVLIYTIIFLSINVIGQQTDIIGPAGSDSFGRDVIALPNGNIVVTDPDYDIPGGNQNVGAVYLYDGSNGNLISTLTGSTTDDRVGNRGVTALTNGNYVIRSPGWDNGGATDAGAVTWGDGTTGISGVVSDLNSLVGTTANDAIGNNGVTILNNGNYVVRSTSWDNGGATDAGAVTWGDGTTGVSGVVSASNSLVGSTTFDAVGNVGVRALTNGSYVVSSPNWDNGGTSNVGAVTWGDGTIGVSGVITSSNSLVGSTASDRVGNFGVTALANGNYVVRSTSWNNGGATDAGAVTWGDGTTGTSGVITSSNSLVGSTAFDQVGFSGVTALTNGNYVVVSAGWNNGGATEVGAATWGDGTTGVSGVVSVSNSLIGSTTDDSVGFDGVTALTNGNYVVRTTFWDNGGAIDAGAVTFGNGTTGTTGVVSVSNSLVGSTANDQVGNFVGNFGVTALANGNYVVRSTRWDNGGVTDAGAVTWGDGTTGVTGVITSSNSLVGSTAFDQVGFSGVTALTNGNYVVGSFLWDNGGATDAGAVTFGNGTTGTTGVVSVSNSLVGSTASDRVGIDGVTALTNGNYVVGSFLWDNGGTSNVGAATWGDGTTGTTGVVSVSNSLVGSTANDFVGGNGVTALTNGNYVVSSSGWDNGGTANAGAISYLSGLTGNFSQPFLAKEKSQSTKKTPTDSLAVSMTNSVIGTTANGGGQMNFSFDSANTQLVVGRPADNIVTLFDRFLVTAADVSISGRVTTANGIGIPRATVSMSDANGTVRTARVNQFGYFQFEDVEAGGTYIFETRAKGYTFSTQVLNVDDNITDFNITAQ